MHKKPSIGRFLTTLAAFSASLYAGVARDLAASKGGFNRKKKKSGGKKSRRPYEWGTLGLSRVSEAIKKDYDKILSRKERRQFAHTYRGFGSTFKAYYNGPVHGIPKVKKGRK